MSDDEREVWTQLSLRPVHWLCPSCKKVIRRTTERAETPTATTRTAPEPCKACQR